MNRILMVRLGAMGDVIQTLPAAADLRSLFPAARISWAVESRWAPLLADNPHLSQVIPVGMRRWRARGLRLGTVREAAALLRLLGGERFDLAIDFQGLLKSAVLSALSRPERIMGMARKALREPAAEVFYGRRIGAHCVHVVDRYRELAARASGQPYSHGPAVSPLPDGELRDGLPDRFVLASPQAGWGAKQWPARHYGELASILWHELRVPLVADCAPGQEGLAEGIQGMAPRGAVLTHPSSIPQLIGATRKATAVVGVDSGPLHMAAALGKPGVAIFGPTDPGRNGPYRSGLAVLRDPSAPTSYARQAEPAASMRSQSPESVARHLRPILDSVD